MHGQWEANAWTSRFLLLAAVLLGTAAIHSLGRPLETGPWHPYGSDSTAASALDRTAHGQALPDRAPSGAVRTEPSLSAAGPAPLVGPALSAVWTAVLAVWVVLTLIARPGLRPAGLLAVTRARLLCELPAIPLPWRTVIARLPVLRR